MEGRPLEHKKSVSDSFMRVGVISTIIIILFSLWFSSLFRFEIFVGWVAFIWMIAVPAQIIMGIHLQFNSPEPIASLPQPKKGLAYLGITLIPMALGGAFLFIVPGGMEPPGPFLINVTIITIVAAFWLVAAWQCWPFVLLTKKPFTQALLLLVAAHLLGYAIYQVTFDFAGMKADPVYNADLDPHGLFDAWYALSFSVMTVAVLMIMSLFDFLPCTRVSTRQPVLGLCITATCLIVSVAIFWISNTVLQLDPVVFMLDFSINAIFGVFLVKNMMNFQLLNQVAQPLRGTLLLIIAMSAAYLLQLLYRFVAQLLFEFPTPLQAPYELEVWVATALLAITFPLINVVSGYFAFWPLNRSKQDHPAYRFVENESRHKIVK
jgi:hypothetical protein